MSKQFIKLTLNFEYEREVLINVECLIDVVEYEDFTLVTMNNGNKYEVKESADEVNNLIEGKEPKPINVPWTNPTITPQPLTGNPYWYGTTSVTTQLDIDNTTLTISGDDTGIISCNDNGVSTFDVNHI